ncbi:hypothetical protein [Conexibacter woesei]|uniref:hypothetical protein n=1 Tax=Conexibacter woesei TaxID=191495 RepID=UPI0004174CEA|nr:hypothetical protein [Conexibacter woesei]
MATHASEHPHAATAPARAPGRAATLLRHPWIVEGAWTVLAMAIGLLIATLVYHLWDAKLHVPFNGSGDGALNLLLAKDLIDHGWYFTNHALGAPSGQELYDYSAFDADNLQVIGMKILTLGISEPVALVNVYFILGFAFTSAAGYLGSRALGFSRGVALLGSAVFTALPYHFERGASHLFLGEYFVIPGAVWLIVTALQGQPILVAREGVTGWRRWLTPRTFAVAFVCLLAGGCGLYYAVFTILLVGLAAVLRAIATRSWRSGVPGVLAAAAIGVVLIVNISPALAYQHKHGKDEPVAKRFAFESELYATSLTQMLLPIGNHRIGAFAKLTDRHTTTTPVRGEMGQPLGLLGALGFIGLLLVGSSRLLRGPPERPDRFTGLLGAATVGGVLAFLWATFGGIASFFAYVISPQIRAWSRLTPFIAFFALLAVLVVAERLRGRIIASGGLGRRVAAGAVLAAVAVLGVLDQTSPKDEPVYASTIGSWANNQHFVSALEQSVPKGSMILQLPFHAFPEAGDVNGMQDYDLLQGYLHSRDLRWSYGAMKGRPADWTDEAEQQPLPWVLRAAVAAGFAGVYIDRAGYADHGVAAEKTVRRVLGGAPAVTGDDWGRLVFYSGLALRARQQQTMTPAQRAALGNALVHPVDLEYGDGVYDEEPGAAGAPPFRWIGPDATIDVVNPGSQATGSFEATAAAGEGSMTVTAPGQAPTVVRFTNGREKVRVPLTLPAHGTVRLTFHADVPRQGVPPETRDLRVQLFGAQFAADGAS